MYSQVDNMFSPPHKSRSSHSASDMKQHFYQDTADQTEGSFDIEINFTDNEAYISKPTIKTTPTPTNDLISPYAYTKPELPPKPKRH